MTVLFSMLWCLALIVGMGLYSFKLLVYYISTLCHLYFRRIEIRGLDNITSCVDAPIIVAPNHPNMLVDGYIVITELSIGTKKQCYVWVKACMFEYPILGRVLTTIGCVPVFRPPSKDQDNDSLSSSKRQAAATTMFLKTWEVLRRNKNQNLIVLFPEGTSYTRSSMLPLKTGVMRLATGYVDRYHEAIHVVPAGLTYSSKDSFQSDVVLEFGPPIVVSPTTQKSQSSREVVRSLTSDLSSAMQRVTLNAQSEKDLVVSRIISNIYITSDERSNAKSLEDIIRKVISVLDPKENEVLYKTVAEFADALKEKDLALEMVLESSDATFYKTCLLVILFLPVFIPALVLNFPYYFLAKKMNTFAGYTESKSMFKIVVLGITLPLQWTVIASALSWNYDNIVIKSAVFAVSCITFASLSYTQFYVIELIRRLRVHLKFKADIETLRKQRKEILLPMVLDFMKGVVA